MMVEEIFYIYIIRRRMGKKKTYEEDTIWVLL